MDTVEPPAVRILIVEDHPIVVAGVRALIAEQPGVEVVADARDVPQAIAALSELSPPPDIAIVDIALASSDGTRGSGLDVVQWIADHRLPTRVLILSMYDEPAYVLTALRLQVAGYVSKGTDLHGIVTAIQTVQEGRQYLSPSLASVVAAGYQAQARGASLDPYEEVLSTRERELVQLVGRGISLKEAAEQMGIAHRTAGQYRASAMRKIGLTTYEEFAQWAAERLKAPFSR